MKQKIMVLMLMVAAVFSSHARKLSQISKMADNTSGVEVGRGDAGGGGATCET